jgi:hypothetical protein
MDGKNRRYHKEIWRKSIHNNPTKPPRKDL